MTARVCSTSFWLLAALLVSGVRPSAAESARQAQDEHFLAEELPPKAACCPAEIVYRITDKATGEALEISLVARIEEVRDFFFASGSKLVVEGSLRYGGSNLLIADPRTGKLEEEIWNYGHRFSPSGRFLVYRTHYPRMTPPAARRSLVLLYDLAAGPAANRFGGESQRNPQEGVGLPIYPDANAERLSFDVFLSADRLYVSPFLWAEDEASVVFFDCEKDWSACHLVRVGLDENVILGAAAPVIRRTVLDLHPYTRREGAWTFTGGPEDPVRLAVESLEWSEDGKAVVVHPEPASSLIERFEVPLSR